MGVATTISKNLNIPFELILLRTKKIKKLSECSDMNERFQSISGSLKIKEQFKDQWRKNGEFLIMLDDVKTTGISVLEAKKVLMGANVENILVIAFGINNHIEPESGGGVWKRIV
jgi:predicted amidophosphoribosyltransferase